MSATYPISNILDLCCANGTKTPPGVVESAERESDRGREVKPTAATTLLLLLIVDKYHPTYFFRFPPQQETQPMVPT